MLNIELQCCGLYMLMLLLFISTREQFLRTRSKRLFFYAFFSCIVCLILDVASIYGIYRTSIGDWSFTYTKIICKLYIMGLVFQAYQGFLYAAGELFSGEAHRGLRLFYEFSAIIGIVLIAVLPIDYVYEGKVTYTYGLSTTATYFFCLLFIISTIVAAFRHTEYASKRRRRSILIWQGSWLLAALIQLLHPEFLLVGLAGVIGIYVIYAELENPQEGLDRMTGQYSANALMDYVRDRYLSDKRFSAIDLWLDRLNQEINADEEIHIMINTANYLSTQKGARVFRNDGNRFVILFAERQDMEEADQRIGKELQMIVGPMIRIKRLVIPDSAVVTNSVDFFQFHNYFLPEFEEKSYLTVDADAVKRLMEYKRIKEMVENALDYDRVEVFYQPIYGVKERRFVTAEALVRIRDVDGSVISPGVFIPIAEQNGLIIPLGLEVFRQVCELISTIDIRRLGLHHIEVNLSVAQFDQKSLADDFIGVMDEYGIDPALINLEITETASTNARRILMENMEKLRTHGVSFSLDDFGTGRCNLDYFVDMPVDIIKFDNNFTKAYFESPKARTVMESVIDMIRKMKLLIVSEGVETKEQLDAMCAIGVDYIQGFYFSKPVPRDEFLSFILEHPAL